MQLRPMALFCRKFLCRNFILSNTLKIALVALLAACQSRAVAQADATEFKTQAIAVFAGYVHDNIDAFPRSDNGVAFGLDFTRYIRFPVQPSIEGRVNFASGPVANEKSYLIGLRVDYRIRRYHPYVDFVGGLGTIHYNPPSGISFPGDNSKVYSPGLGVDIDLVHHIQAKIDFQHQYWNTGHTSITEFQPSLLTLGIRYPIPFRPFHRQGEPHY